MGSPSISGTYLVSTAMEVERFYPELVVYERMFSSVLEAVVVETALTTVKSLAWFFLAVGSLSVDMSMVLNVPSTDKRFPMEELHRMRRPDPDNKDASDTEDDDDDDDDGEGVDEEEDGGDEVSGDEPNDDDDGGDPEDDAQANGDGGGDDEDDDDEDEDEEDDDDEEEDEEEEEEDEEDDEGEDFQQPPAKKRK